MPGDPSGERDTTIAIQSAIDAGSAKGHPVLVPPGTFLVTRPLIIRNGSHLHVQAGGVLRSSPDLDALDPAVTLV
jgi:polygalacturonase